MTLSISDPNLTVLAGLLVPYVTAVVKQPGLPRRLVVGVVSALSLGAGYFVAARSGQLVPDDVLGNALAILGVSQGFYSTIGRHLGLPELEAVTNRPESAEDDVNEDEELAA